MSTSRKRKDQEIIKSLFQKGNGARLESRL
jgi:hypothetical protein